MSRLVDDYFAEEFDFGGELMTRAAIYQWHKDNGLTQREADYWFMGVSLMIERQAERDRLAVPQPSQ